ncbi:MAG: coproporphyrinogen dehydrogenase HemZ, partial [Clostridiales bacterium]|nr:coproporphyrinogen dehydrogenase HemZ [Clostridiales bacterium]
MIKLRNIPNRLQYDFMHISKLFFKDVKLNNDTIDDGYVIEIVQNDDEMKISLFFGGKIINERISGIEKNSVKLALYDVFSTVRESKSEYGILVGVRPVKVVHKLLDGNNDIGEIKRILEKDYRIGTEKINLLLEVALKERNLIFKDFDAISLYIGIPFCPSICTYCSFPSNDINKKAKLVNPYMEYLIKEIKETFELLKITNRRIDNIYIGGGTPTSISNKQIKMMLETIDEYVNSDDLNEYTIEAGRPDTITYEKLETIKRYGITRICLNPQSMSNKVLEKIGRNHTREDILDAYKIVEEFNFNSVNMDLIVGLPEDTIESLKMTIDEVVSLRPENITVHTLAIKKASHIKNNQEKYNLAKSDEILKMLLYVEKKMSESGYEPYYLYRQKNILGNFENIGYALKGKESIYNMRIIEERHNILALGVGGVSKKIIDDDYFIRIPNFRSVEDYISRFDEIIDRKKKFLNLT